MSDELTQYDRSHPLPKEMQGTWFDSEEPENSLDINGGEITCLGEIVQYDFKHMGILDGAIVVSLGVHDAAKEDTFQQANITELVIDPDGQFYAYNVTFSLELVRG